MVRKLLTEAHLSYLVRIKLCLFTVTNFISLDVIYLYRRNDFCDVKYEIEVTKCKFLNKSKASSTDWR